jgi:hypothetical protein
VLVERERALRNELFSSSELLDFIILLLALRLNKLFPSILYNIDGKFDYI